jgi:hypothetical protein
MATVAGAVPEERTKREDQERERPKESTKREDQKRGPDSVVEYNHPTKGHCTGRQA